MKKPGTKRMRKRVTTGDPGVSRSSVECASDPERVNEIWGQTISTRALRSEVRRRMDDLCQGAQS
ncbi:hypothetical protein H2204_011662 [Knufia peltigerae]|uniref:Uncharacterized protein n=1 Tax=Knufia peltigerae TaxID=1002370 RepID=A0AA39CRP0_9EURO|nr:hypothetical protein H2204_011662 [Knufia peltigerae]